MNPVEWQFLEAEELLKKGAFKEAEERYEQLGQASLSYALKIRRRDALGYLSEVRGNTDGAEAIFRETIAWIEARAPERQADLARSLNNLGRLLMRKDPKEAIPCFDRSCELFRGMAETLPDYRLHLANSLTARAEAHGMRKKYWYAKRDYKEAIGLYEALDAEAFRDAIAYARYQLGSIYQEEFNAYDARNQYGKALKVYLEASGEKPDAYLPLYAASCNNMAQVHQDLEDYDKAEEALREALQAYQRLCETNSDQYTPYLAATHTHLAILRAENRSDPDGAREQIDLAIEKYGALQADQPEQFTHYWATALHNAGVIRAEARQWEAAAGFLERALDQRRELEIKQPGAFSADLCATALNLAECYLNQIQSPEQWAFRDKALKLLRETEPFLQGLPDQPSTRNMKVDHTAMTGRLENMDRSDILCEYAIRQTRRLEDDIDGTLELDEKIRYQQGVLALWEEVAASGAAPDKYQGEWLRALNNTAWLYIRDGKAQAARELLERARGMDPDFKAALCNLAHCQLLLGEPDAANRGYRALWNSLHHSGKTFGEVINQDLLQLVKAGLLDAHQIPRPGMTHPTP